MFESSIGFGNSAEANERVVGAPVALAPHIGEREAEIDETVVGQREGGVIERLQQRASDEMRLLVAALTRPGMQRELMLLARLGAGREIVHARLAECHV